MPTVPMDDIQLYYEVHGQGDPLMLVAGLASDSQSWQPILEELSSQHSVIVFDNRGVGRTPPSGTDMTIRQMADDCIALARHLGLPSFSLLGHSMGGYIAQDCAARYPRFIDRLILAGTATRTSKRNIALFSDWAACLETGMDPEIWFRNIFFWVFAPRFFENEAAVREAIRFELDYPYPINPSTFRKQVEAIAAFDGGETASIAAPTLVLAAEEDLLMPPEEGLKLSKTIPGAVFRTIEHAAHSLFTENPKEFAAAVLDFLSQGK